MQCKFAERPDTESLLLMLGKYAKRRGARLQAAGSSRNPLVLERDAIRGCWGQLFGVRDLFVSAIRDFAFSLMAVPHSDAS